MLLCPRIPPTSLLVCWTLVLLLSPLPTLESADPDLQTSTNCKQRPLPGNASDGVRQYVTCWVPSELKHLGCQVDWNVLHLKVLTPVSRHKKRASAANPQPRVRLQPSLLSGCGHLIGLAIREESALTHLQRELFKPVPRLTRLRVVSPQLQQIEHHLLVYLPMLQQLIISGSHSLAPLSRKTMDPCPATLVTLRLTGNNFDGELKSSMFVQCIQLRQLYLNDNKLMGLVPGSLAGLKQLKSLGLSRNQLQGTLEEAVGLPSRSEGAIVPSALASVPRLHALDLSGNRFTEIRGPSWSGLCEDANSPVSGSLCLLRMLNLANNKLRWLAPNAFSGLPNLMTLRLETNPDLLTLYSAGSLALALFALIKEVHPRLECISLSKVEQQEGGVRRIADDWEVCSVDDYSDLPPLIRVVVDIMKTSVCLPESYTTPAQNELPHVTSNLPIAPRTLTAEPLSNSLCPRYCAPSGVLQLSSEGSLMRYLRSADRWVLAVIGVFLLIIGAGISGLLWCVITLCGSSSKK